MKFGIALGRLHPGFFVDCTLEAERLGYESAWLPEHLVLTTQMSRSPHPGETHPPVPPETPVFDPFAYLGYLAGRFSGKTWANGDTMVPEEALGHLAAEGFEFTVKGRPSYAREYAPVRDSAPTAV